MRLSAFAVIAASAVLAQVGAAPAPFRLLVVTSSVEEVSQFKDVRFGHAAPFIDRALLNSNNPPATSDNPTPDGATSKRLRHRKGCHGKKSQSRHLRSQDQDKSYQDWELLQKGARLAFD